MHACAYSSETRRIWPDPLAVVVGRSHPLARARKVSLRELVAHPAVLPDERTYTHRIITAEFRRRGKFVVAGSIEAKLLTVVDVQNEQPVWQINFDAGPRTMAIEANPDGYS